MALVIAIREHPNEASAFYLGKKVYERLVQLGYDARLERCPIELTPLGFIKGYQFDHSYKKLMRWYLSLLEDGDVLLSFHNTRENTDRRNAPYFINEEYDNIWILEIPATYKNMGNPVILERAEELSRENSNVLPNFGYIIKVVDMKACREKGQLTEEFVDKLTDMIEKKFGLKSESFWQRFWERLVTAHA